MNGFTKLLLLSHPAVIDKHDYLFEIMFSPDQCTVSPILTLLALFFSVALSS